MASKSLGTLTLDLVARIGGFTGPMDKASRETQKRMAEIKKSAEQLGKGIGTALAAVPAIVAGLVTSSAMAAKEISNLASISGLSTTEFQRYAAGAASVGIEQDKLSDIFKDTNDKIGDFLATGGGELKNFFETIAPQVGVTAEQFRNLNSADALQLYVSSLQKANVSQAQMTFFMEAIADEATALVPLLADGGRKFKELGDAAQSTGMILDDATISSAKEFNNQLTVLGQYASSAKTALAAEFMPVLAQLSKDLVDTTKEAGGLQSQMKSLANSLVETTAVVASIGDGIARAFKITAQALVGSFDTAMYYFNSIGAAGNEILGKITFGETSREFRTAAENMRQDALVNFGNARVAAEAIGKELEKPLAGDAIREYVAKARQAYADLPKLTPGASGPGFVGQTDAQKAAQKEAEAAAKKLNQTFETTEENLKRQIALINTSADARKKATEVAKLQFEIESGRLVGINEKQQERLKGLAAELDRLQKLKQANEDAAKAQAFGATLSEANRTARGGFDLELAGAGESDKMKERLQADLAIQQDYQSQLAELQKQYNGGDISEELYNQETELLRNALAERMEIQQEYYARQDEVQANWLDGVSSAWGNYLDQAQDISGQTKSMFSDAFSGMNDALYGFVTTGKLSMDDMVATFAQSALRMLIQWGTAQVAMAALNAFTSTAAIPIVGPLAAPAAAASALGSAGSFMSMISSVAGMAHDGIDAVPEDGTWYLQKGERVTTAETSAKLDQTLSRIQADQDGQRQQSASGQPQLNVYNAPSGTKATARMENKQWVIDVICGSLAGDEQVHEVFSNKYGLSTVGR